jgi:hypothetical protein
MYTLDFHLKKYKIGDKLFLVILWLPPLNKNKLHVSEMLRLKIAQKCTNFQSTFRSTIHWNFPNIG